MDKPISAGDLARIIQSEAYPESVGWIVRVTRRVENWIEGNAWWIEHAPLGGMRRTETSIPAQWLRRIPPLDELEDVRQDEEITA